MSDNWIRLVPTSMTWEPTPESATAATAYVAGLFAGRGGSAEEVIHEFHGQVTLIDSGVNTQSAACNLCGQTLDLEWAYDTIDERAGDLSRLDVVMPCCGVTSSLNDLEYDWPIAFARFEIGVVNATRAVYELQPDELDRLGAILGHPVRQILAHY